jgi:hypothetical protein
MWDRAQQMPGADLVKIKISLVFAMLLVLLIAGKSKGNLPLLFYQSHSHSLADQTVFFEHVLQAAQSLTDA